MSKTTINYSDKLLLLAVMDYLIADVSTTDRWSTPGESTARTLMQLRSTRSLIETETNKISSVFLNNVFVAIEFFRPVATKGQKRQLTMIRNVFCSLPRVQELLLAAEIPDQKSAEFVILVGAG